MEELRREKTPEEKAKIRKALRDNKKRREKNKLLNIYQIKMNEGLTLTEQDNLTMAKLSAIINAPAPTMPSTMPISNIYTPATQPIGIQKFETQETSTKLLNKQSVKENVQLTLYKHIQEIAEDEPAIYIYDELLKYFDEKQIKICNSIWSRILDKIKKTFSSGVNEEQVINMIISIVNNYESTLQQQEATAKHLKAPIDAQNIVNTKTASTDKTNLEAKLKNEETEIGKLDKKNEVLKDNNKTLQIELNNMQPIKDNFDKAAKAVDTYRNTYIIGKGYYVSYKKEDAINPPVWTVYEKNKKKQSSQMTTNYTILNLDLLAKKQEFEKIEKQYNNAKNEIENNNKQIQIHQTEKTKKEEDAFDIKKRINFLSQTYGVGFKLQKRQYIKKRPEGKYKNPIKFGSGHTNKTEYKQLNKYMVNMNELHKNRIVLKYVRNRNKIENYKPDIISDDVKNIIIELIENDHISKSDFSKLTAKDKTAILNFLNACHIDIGENTIEDKKTIFKVLIGELQADNSNPKIKQQLKELLIDGVENKEININDALNCIKELKL